MRQKKQIYKKGHLRDKTNYNPPINFYARSLDKSHHVVQNRTTGISEYTPSDLISVARFCWQAKNKRMKSPYSILNHRVKKSRYPINLHLFQPQLRRVYYVGFFL